ncbi:MAG: BatA domain-containing protein [Candidatus Cyclobacteriaceae bacterium M3_2C_046]
MSFLYPTFLYGLFALSIPIIIHLFNFRKAKRIYFSSNQFLKNIKKISSSKLKLKHLLVLASRLLFILFLVLTFAQPYIPSQDKGLSHENVYIYLDNSLSMSNEIAADLSAFEAGISYIDQITDLYPSSTRYKLLTNDFAPFSNNLKSKNEIKELITELKLSGVSRSLQDVNDRLISSNYNFNQKNDIYWISDFQRSTLGGLDGIVTDSSASIFIVPLEYQERKNIFVDSVYLKNPFLIANEANELYVRIKNVGDDDVQDLIVKLFINDVQSANASIDIENNATNTLNFPLNFGLSKYNSCRISFEEFPVTFDNDFYFTLNLMDRINILEVKSQNQNTVLSKVYGNKTLFNFLSYSINNLNYSLIENSDLVILNGINEIDPSLMDVINQYIENEGDIMVIPSASPNIDSYNSLVKNTAIQVETKPVQLSLSNPDLNNPFFENIFEDEQENFDMPTATNLINWYDQAGKLLEYSNEKSYLSVTGNNRNIYLLGSPLADEYTNFHQHAIFVPVMYRIAALSKKSNENLYYSLNESVISLSMDSLKRDDMYMLVKGEQELIPSQQSSGNKLILEVPKFMLNTGFYDLSLEGQVNKILAFNQDKQESLLAQYQQEELNDILRAQNIEIYKFAEVENFTKEMEARHMGNSLWKYTLILALIFLLAEVLLLRYL